MTNDICGIESIVPAGLVMTGPIPALKRRAIVGSPFGTRLQALQIFEDHFGCDFGEAMVLAAADECAPDAFAIVGVQETVFGAGWTEVRSVQGTAIW